MKLLSIIPILGFIVFTTANATAQPKEKQSDNPPILAQQLTAAQEEVRLLKAELLIIKSYQDNLLSTVYWSLGVLGTIAVGLVGFGWFANFRIYERDKLALSQELRAINKEEIRKHTRAIPELIEANAKQKLVVMQGEFNSLKMELLNRLIKAEIDILESKHKQWVDDKVFANAITISADLLDRALQGNQLWRIANYLDFIRQDISGIRVQNMPMMPSNISELMGLLDKTGSEHLIAVNKIKELLAKVKTMD